MHFMHLISVRSPKTQYIVPLIYIEIGQVYIGNVLHLNKRRNDYHLDFFSSSNCLEMSGSENLLDRRHMMLRSLA
jgi:hypothetical protein